MTLKQLLIKDDFVNFWRLHKILFWKFGPLFLSKFILLSFETYSENSEYVSNEVKLKSKKLSWKTQSYLGVDPKNL